MTTRLSIHLDRGVSTRILKLKIPFTVKKRPLQITILTSAYSDWRCEEMILPQLELSACSVCTAKQFSSENYYTRLVVRPEAKLVLRFSHIVVVLGRVSLCHLSQVSVHREWTNIDV